MGARLHDLSRSLELGHTVEIEIEGIGVLSNTVAA
jgi:2-keto-4-pentenoate hydratase/2-oxohepta-3-ene-1,7-dioic acid hydratase in catechol pathway